MGTQVMTPGFLTITAGLHVAPAAAAITTVVEEEPLAIGSPALANGSAIVRNEKAGGGFRYRPQHSVKKIAST